MDVDETDIAENFELPGADHLAPGELGAHQAARSADKPGLVHRREPLLDRPRLPGVIERIDRCKADNGLGLDIRAGIRGVREALLECCAESPERLIVDLIELTLNHGMFVVRAASTLSTNQPCAWLPMPAPPWANQPPTVDAGALALEPIEKFISQKIRVEWAEDELYLSEIKPTSEERRRYAEEKRQRLAARGGGPRQGRGGERGQGRPDSRGGARSDGGRRRPSRGH